MALFSRRPKPSDEQPPVPAGAPDEQPPVPAAAPDEQPATPAAAPDGPVEQTPEAAAAESTVEPTASVGISVSSFQGLGAAQPAPQTVRPPAPDPRRTAETVPGLRDNVLLRESLATLPENPTPLQVLDLARQVLQGHLFLRIRGDARALLAEGKNLPLGVASIGDRRFALAYSSGAALTASIRADGDTATSALGQPAIAVLRHVQEGELEGLVIDPASAPARAILPRALIERMLVALDEKLEIKTLLAGERTDATPAAVVDAITRAPLWVAVNTPGDDGRIGVAEGRSQDGSRFLEVYSHPLEVVAMGREDRSAPITAEQLAKTLRADPALSGVLVDPRGPWMRLSRDELAPVLALLD